MYILDRLWLGDLNPSEIHISQNSEYYDKLLQLCRISDGISEDLSPKGKDLFEKYLNTLAEIQSIENLSAFTNGFRIGIGLLLDAVTGL